jgi:transposase-like protein
MDEPKNLPKTLIEAIRYFSDQDVCVQFVAKLRWPDGPACPTCGGTEHSYLKTRRVWKCKACKRQFSVKVGSIFEDLAIPLDKWPAAMWMIANSKNGISSHEMARSLGITLVARGIPSDPFPVLRADAIIGRFRGVLDPTLVQAAHSSRIGESSISLPSFERRSIELE